MRVAGLYSRPALDAVVRLAAPSAYVAVVAVLLAGVTIALFFTIGEPFGTINDFFDAIALLLLVPPVLAVQSRVGDDAGGWLAPLTILTVLGLVVAGVGQFLLIAKVIDLNGSYMTGGIGILPVLVWIVALVWLSLGRHLFPDALGWLALAILASAVLIAVFAALKVDLAVWAFSIVLIAALLGWLVALGMALASPEPRPL